MEKYNQIQYVIGKDDLKEIINEILDERMDELITKWEEAKNRDGFVSSKKAMEILRVSQTTLWRWKKVGYLVPEMCGGKCFYRMKDIDRILNNLL